MSHSWINPKIIIGNSATGDYYFDRPHIVSDIWEEVQKSNHVLIAAPRRVGKSSIMEYMASNPKGDIKCIFKNIQGVESENEFYKTFYELVVYALNSAQKKWLWLTNLWRDLKIEEISLEGVRLNKHEVNFLSEINLIVHKLEDKGIRLVLFIDEMPEVLYRLHKNERTQEAVSILKNLRSWLLSPEFKHSISLVLAGSVGIDHVVQLIEGRTADINHLRRVDFDAMDRIAAAAYINWATRGATIQYNESLRDFLLDKITYYVPYFVNLLLDEINKTARKINNANVTETTINMAFEKVVASNDHFVDWKNRLFDYMPVDSAIFLNAILAYIAWHNSISLRKIYDIAVRHGFAHSYMELMNVLVRDGYIVLLDESYSFISPFLQAFWKRINPNHNEQ